MKSRLKLKAIVAGYLTAVAAAPDLSGQLVITNIWPASAGVVLAGRGGSNNTTYHLLASTTLATPSVDWPAVATNTFDVNGTFILTNPAQPAVQYFRLSVPPAPAMAPDFSLIGFATLAGFATNSTLLAGGTTGGTVGPVVVASNLTWLVNYAQRSNQPLRVLITADIDCSSLNNNNSAPGYLTGRVNVNSDKTIYSTNGATISRGTLNISSRQNVIVRNLRFRDMYVFDPTGAYDTYGWDYIAVTGSHHVWVDHCDFERVYDGMVDVVNGSDYVTVSWNVFRDQKKCSLVGNSDGATGDRSKLNVTYHHNWFVNVDERTPRMRFGNAHVFNQYTDNRTATNSTGKCIQATTESAVLVERVYFTHATNAYPTVFVNGGGVGNALKVVGSVITNSPGNRGFAETNAATFVFNAPWVTNAPPYSYTLDLVADVPSLVTNWAGVGKLTSF
jgi:pectate lyase